MRVTLFAFLILFFYPLYAFAFFDRENLHLNGFINLIGIATEDQSSEKQIDFQGDRDGRLMLDAKLNEGILLELHVVNENSRVIDRLNLKWAADPVALTLGRQPINLATVFYFSPNDFFSPFSPETFFRVYKPGVDAARLEFRRNDLSQISFIAVEGSFLARISDARGGLEGGLILGDIKDQLILGGSLQGEFFEGLGVRGEGHFAKRNNKDVFSKIAVAVDHRFENGIQFKLEQYYNGEPSASRSLFASKAYTAIGAGKRLTPLFSADGVVFVNLIDSSSLAAIYTVYSLADELELAQTFLVPIGQDPQSEFGQLPYLMGIELRYYF